MRDQWYADNIDVIKWSVLHELAQRYDVGRILQIAYYRPSATPQISIDGDAVNVPSAISSHFRDLRTVAALQTNVRITVFDVEFVNRQQYHEAVRHLLLAFNQGRCIVFLDPDIGLEPDRNPKYEHVLDLEASAIWQAVKADDLFVFYQHQTNRKGKEWVRPKRAQLARALGLADERVRVATGEKIARDVVFYFVQKS